MIFIWQEGANIVLKKKEFTSSILVWFHITRLGCFGFNLDKACWTVTGVEVTHANSLALAKSLANVKHVDLLIKQEERSSKELIYGMVCHEFILASRTVSDSFPNFHMATGPLGQTLLLGMLPVQRGKTGQRFFSG